MVETFGQRLQERIRALGPLCVGIDPSVVLLDAWGRPDTIEGLEFFSLAVLEAAMGSAAAVKPQVAYFERFGSAGYRVLERLISDARDADILVIALGRRLREMNERLSRQSFQTVQSRVAVVLSQLVEQEIADGKDPVDVLVTATQADLAQLAGSSRESASRFLAVLERAGVISQGRGRLVVHDADALKQYVF